MNPDQTAPKGAVLSGYILFAANCNIGYLKSKADEHSRQVTGGLRVKQLGLIVRKSVFKGLRTPKAQTSLRIWAV